MTKEMKKRDELKRLYMSAKWARKINKMSDAEIVVMYNVYKSEGKIK